MPTIEKATGWSGSATTEDTVIGVTGHRCGGVHFFNLSESGDLLVSIISFHGTEDFSIIPPGRDEYFISEGIRRITVKSSSGSVFFVGNSVKGATK